MIGKIFRTLTAVTTLFCVATVIALAILTFYYAKAWQLDREKLKNMLAAAQGVDIEAAKEQPATDRPLLSTEQPSYEQMLEVRAVKLRNLELREQSLRTSVDQSRLDEQRLVEQRKQLTDLREGFQGELLAVQKTATSAGRDEVRRTLETLKPALAKSLLAQMLEKQEMDEVVLLVAGMPETKRAKILAEFKTPAELEQVGEVLRRIRQGVPTATIAENAQQKTDPASKGPGS